MSGGARRRSLSLQSPETLLSQGLLNFHCSCWPPHQLKTCWLLLTTPPSTLVFPLPAPSSCMAPNILVGPIFIAPHQSPEGGFPGGPVVKNLPAKAGDVDLIPGSGRSPGGGNGTPLQYSCLGNPLDRGAWQATVHGVAKSQTRLSTYTLRLHYCSPGPTHPTDPYICRALIPTSKSTFSHHWQVHRASA